MKKLLITFAAICMTVVSASAMSYEQAREQALFLTDKMAYELNLTEEQYEAAYEINLDYLMSVNHYNDLYGLYWEHRNLDLSYILLDWQYRAFLNASYFYRPLYWRDGFWHFGIYARYPYRDYFYFGMPRFYAVYRGGHSWHHNGGRSWYHGRDWHHSRPGGHHSGMRDGFHRGDYGQGNRGMNPPSHGNNSGVRFGDNARPNANGHSTATDGRMGSASSRSGATGNTHSGNGAFGGSRSGNSGSFGGNRNGSNGSSSTRFGRESSTRTTVNNPPARSAGSSSSYGSSSVRSSSSSTRSSSSFGGSSSRSSNSSFSRGSSSSHSSAGSSSHSSGGGRSSGGSRGGGFGGRR